MQLTRMQWVALGGGVAAGAALGVALASEWGLGLVPCALCLWERWPYRIVIALCVLALAWRRWSAPFLIGAATVALIGAGFGLVHLGVEHGWWASPLPECAAPSLGGGSIAERLARLPARPAKPCDDPTYLIPFIPVSMAEMNTVFALALGAFLYAPVLKRTRP